MKVKLSKRALKAYRKLDNNIKKKTDKQFLLIDKDIKHPSLKTKKMPGLQRYESRIDYHYRFTFIIDTETGTLLILTIGMHDIGLGKK